MKVLIFFVLQLLFLTNLHAEAPNLLTYQGRLKEGGQAVSGNRLVKILLCDSESGVTCHSSGAQSVTVSNGLFRSTFTVPGTALVGTGNWYLEIEVEGVTLTPRERLTSTAYSLFAATAAYASNIAAAEGSDGVHITSNVYIVGFSSATKFYGDGSELTNLPASGGAVATTGDTMTGTLTMNAASALTTGNQQELVISTNVYMVGYSSAAMYYGDGSLLTGISATTVADGSVTDAKIVTVSSSKLTGTVPAALVDLSTVTTALAGKLANNETVSPLLIGLSTVTTALGTKLDKAGDIMTGQLTLAGSTLTVISPDSGASSLWVSTSATTPHLYVSTTGKVGLGTALPAYLLDVNGKGNFADNVSITGVDVGAPNSNTNALTVYGGGGWYPIASFRTSIAVNPMIEVAQPSMDRSIQLGIDKAIGLGLVTSWKDFPTGNGMPIWIGPSSGYGGEYNKGLYITVAGNVGLGETIPQAKLHVVSTSTTDSAVFIASHSTAGYGLFVSTNGNVGVGAAGPAYRLVVSSGAGEAGNLVVISTGASNVIRMTGAGEIHANKYYGDGANLTGVSTHTFSIGDSYGGGKVFWVDAAGKQVLVAPTSDQSTGVKWSNNSDTTGANNDGVYAGRANTVIISTMQHAGNYAAQLCADYSVTVNGEYYDDWYLPSKSELSLLYAQKTAIGGFTPDFYWSSNENNAADAALVDFSIGGTPSDTKTGLHNVRCVRAGPSTAIGNLPTNAETVTDGAYLSSTQTFTGGNTITGNSGAYGLTVSSNVSLAGALYTKNARVGINNALPQESLDVNGNILASGLSGAGNRCVYTDSTGVLRPSADACGSAAGLDNMGDHTMIQNLVAGAYWLSGDGNNEGIRIDSDGKVGVGVAVPQAGLNVLSPVQTAGLFEGAGQTELTLQSNGGGTTQFPAYLTFNAYSPLNTGVRAMGYLGFDNSGNMTFSNTNNGFTGGTRMLIAAAGNIGISTGAPQARLDLLAGGSGQADMAQIWRKSNGDIVSSMSATGVMAAARFVGDGSGLTGVADNMGNHTATTTLQMNTFNILNASTVSAKALAIGDGIAVGSLVSLLARPLAADYDYVLYVTTGYYSTSPTLVVSSSGYVGMGTNYPRAKLDVAGNIIAERYQINGSTVVAILQGAGSLGVGVNAGRISTGDFNVFIGSAAGYSATGPGASSNNFLGYMAGYNNSSGNQNNFIGREAGKTNTTGGNNTFVGNSAGYGNDTGMENSYLGDNAGYSNADGRQNVALGASAGAAGGSSYSSSTLVGFGAGSGITSGIGNTFLGYKAGDNVATGGSNIIIGNNQDATASTISDELNIGGVLRGNLNAHTIGINQTLPRAALDIVSTGTASDNIYAQIWRDSNGTPVASMTVTGRLSANGAGITGIIANDSSKLPLTGGDLLGALSVMSNTVTSSTDIATNGIVISTGGAIRTTGLGYGTTAGNSRGGGAVDLQTWRDQANQVAGGIYSVITGGQKNRIDTASTRGFIGGGYGNSISDEQSEGYIGGGFQNALSGTGQARTIGGGMSNTVTGNIATVAGGWNNSASGTYSMSGGGWGNVASGSESSMLGGHFNASAGELSAVGGGAYNVISGSTSVIAGGVYNIVSGTSAVVAGGEGNKGSGKYSAVLGGSGNEASYTYAVAVAGIGNKAFGSYSAVVGGFYNTVYNGGNSNTITGGELNVIQANNNASFIGGGSANYVNDSASYSSVVGGFQNYIFDGAAYSAIAGGGNNRILASVNYAFIGGGANNVSTGAYSTVGGGRLNTSSGAYNAVLGGYNNISSGTYSNIGGGKDNSTYADYAVVGGGLQNKAGITGGGESASTVGGGKYNWASGVYTTISGGYNNRAVVNQGTIGGGQNNVIDSGGSTVIGGGENNYINGNYSTIAGGIQNTLIGAYSAVGGGTYNKIYKGYATIAGGGYNTASATNFSGFPTIGGGSYNSTGGDYATVPGGNWNTAKGDYSFAAGRASSSTASGGFTWADSQGVPVENTVADMTWFKNRGGFLVSGSTNTTDPGFIVSGNGNVGIGITIPTVPLHLNRGGSADKDTLLIGNNSTKGLGIRDTGSSIDIESFGVPLFFQANTGQPVYFYQGPVGIGITASPSAKLEVNQPNLTDYAYTLKVGTGTTSSQLVVSTTGNVGIGTASPGARLEVVETNTAASAFAFKVGTGTIPAMLTVSTNGAVNISGVVTANQFSGDGSGLLASLGLPKIRFTRATVSYADSIAVKDDQCSSEFGTNYVAALTKDIAVGSGMAMGTNTGAYFNTAASDNSYYFNSNFISAATGGTQSLACVQKYSPVRFTRATVLFSNSNAAKDSQCVAEFGANYMAALTKDIAAYGAVIVGGTADGIFVAAGDTTYSFQFNTTAPAGFSTTTAGQHSVACVHK